MHIGAVMSDNRRRTPIFHIGQVVHHKKFGYRGVVVDAHNGFEGSDEWYSKIDRKTHERKLPWYQILVHNRSIETYVAESHLEEDVTKEPINHPYVPVFFNEFEDGTYKVGGMVN